MKIGSVRKCQHGVEVGPLDDFGAKDGEHVKSMYCAECNPRIYQAEDGSFINGIEFAYLTHEEKQKVIGDDSSDSCIADA